VSDELKDGQVWEDAFGDRFTIEATADAFLDGPVAFGWWSGNRSGNDRLKADTLLGGAFKLIGGSGV
jgi:hypothetical protein